MLKRPNLQDHTEIRNSHKLVENYLILQNKCKVLSKHFIEARLRTAQSDQPGIDVGQNHVPMNDFTFGNQQLITLFEIVDFFFLAGAPSLAFQTAWFDNRLLRGPALAHNRPYFPQNLCAKFAVGGKGFLSTTSRINKFDHLN